MINMAGYALGTNKFIALRAKEFKLSLFVFNTWSSFLSRINLLLFQFINFFSKFIYLILLNN
jgi:hypothetical protein